MLFHKSFERLLRAVDRIAKQLATADTQQRQYLLQELEELRTLCNPFFEMWIKFEDQIEALHDQYTNDSTFEDQEQTTHSENTVTPSAPHISAPTYMTEFSTALLSDQGYHFFRKGLGYFDLLMFHESIDEFKKIVDMDPDMVVARLYLAISLIATGAYEEVNTHLDIVQQTATDHVLRAAVHDTRAQMYMRQNNPRSAIKELNAVLSINSTYSDAVFNRAVCAYLLGDYSLAQNSAAQVLSLDKQDIDAWRLYGAALYAKGDFSTACKAYQKTRDLAPKHVQVAIEMATILVSLRRLNEAEAVLREVTIQGRKMSAYYGVLGEIALHRGNAKEAIIFFKKQATLTRTKASLQRLGWALYADKRFDEAAQCFEHHIHTFGQSLQAVIGLARIASHRGKLMTARALLQKLVRDERYKVRAQGLSEIGRMYLEQGDIDRAKRYLHSSLALDRTQESALVFLGVAMRQHALETPILSEPTASTEIVPASGIDSTSLLSDTETTT